MLPYDPSLSMVVLAASMARRNAQRPSCCEGADERLDREPEPDPEPEPRPAHTPRRTLSFPRRLLARAWSRS